MIQLDFEIWWVPLADENIMVEKGETWKVLSLTHVEYKVAHQMSILIIIGSFSPQEDDPMGKLFAIYSLLPLVIVIIFATTFFIRFLLINLSCLKLGHY